MSPGQQTYLASSLLLCQAGSFFVTETLKASVKSSAFLMKVKEAPSTWAAYPQTLLGSLQSPEPLPPLFLTPGPVPFSPGPQHSGPWRNQARAPDGDSVCPRASAVPSPAAAPSSHPRGLARSSELRRPRAVQTPTMSSKPQWD